MVTPLEKAHAYLDTLEAHWRAALALSEQKAEEAKLIKARAEGFQEAIKILRSEIRAGDTGGAPLSNPARRRGRRPIPQLILRELSFSGEAKTTRQIAEAIDYIPERTETALKRMEKAGQVVRDTEGRWALGETAIAQANGHAVGDESDSRPRAEKKARASSQHKSESWRSDPATVSQL
jgi:hypothetical protein